MTKVFLSTLAVLSLAASVSAQPRPLAATTIVSTDTGPTSICVGGNAPAAPATCLGGLQSGTIVANQAVTLPSFVPASTTNRLYSNAGTLFWNGSAVAVGGAVGPGTIGTIPIFSGANSIGDSLLSQAAAVVTLAGTLTSTGFGASSFIGGGVGDQSLTVRNTTAGVANRGVLFVGNDSNAALGSLSAFSSTFTTSGASIADGVRLRGAGTGGLSLQAFDANGAIRFYTGAGTVERGQITAAGAFQWTTFGAHAFTAGGVGGNALAIANPTAGAGNYGQLGVSSDTVNSSLSSLSSTFTTSGPNVQAGTALAGNGAGGVSLVAVHAAGALRIYTANTLRATYAANGDYNLGANLTDSMGVPTLGAGFGASATIAGRVHAFEITLGTTAGAGGTVSFPVTFANAAVCVASVNTLALSPAIVSTTTASVTLAYPVSTAPGAKIAVICRGY